MFPNSIEICSTRGRITHKEFFGRLSTTRIVLEKKPKIPPFFWLNFPWKMVSATPRGPPGVRSRGLSIFNLNLDCRGGGESEKFSSRSTTRKEKSRPSDQPLGKPGRRTPKMPGQRLLFGAPNVIPKLARNSLMCCEWQGQDGENIPPRKTIISIESSSSLIPRKTGDREKEREKSSARFQRREKRRQRELGVENHWHTKQTALWVQRDYTWA